MCPYSYNPLLAGKLDINKKNLNDLEDVNTAGTVNGKVLAFQSGTWIPQTAAGGGDMLISQYVTGQGTVYNASRLAGETLGSVQAHGVDAGTITQGTIGLARVPAMDDAHIPNLETLSYGGTFAEAQIPDLPTTKITSGTFNANRIPVLPTDRYGSALLKDGSRALTADWDIGDGRMIQTDKIRARDAAGLKLYDDADAAASGVFIENGGNVGVGCSAPGGKLTVYGSHREDLILQTGDNLYSQGIAFENSGGAYTWNIYRKEAETNKADLTFAGGADQYIGSLTDWVTFHHAGTVDIHTVLDMDSHKIINVTDPTAAQHAASKNFVDAHVWAANDITEGTLGLARVPVMDDAHIPNLDTLSGGAFGTAQIPSIGAYKITSGTLGVARHETLDNLNGTVDLVQIPTMDDGHIPDLETLSYGGTFADAQIPNAELLSYGAAFGTAQIPSIGAYKIASGTLNADRIPTLPTSSITSGTFDDARIPDIGVVAINYVIDGGGAAIGTGIKGDLEVPFTCHVDRWTLLADQHGSIVVDVWRDAYASFPPTDADSMPGTTNMPAISGTVAAQGTDLSGWGTQGIGAGDILRYNIDSCTSIERCTLALKVTKT